MKRTASLLAALGIVALWDRLIDRLLRRHPAR